MTQNNSVIFKKSDLKWVGVSQFQFAFMIKDVLCIGEGSGNFWANKLRIIRAVDGAGNQLIYPRQPDDSYKYRFASNDLFAGCLEGGTFQW